MTVSKSTIKTNTSDKRNLLPLIIMLVPFVISFFQMRTLDNDFYFLYATGEYITKNGFPYTDMLSMHSNMHIIAQQWLSTVIYYFCYSFFGEYGIFTILYACYAGICFFTYRITLLASKKEVPAAIVAALVCFLVFDPFIVTRPQIFTYLVLLTEIWLLEKHAQTKKLQYLFFVPVLSLLLINLHAAMWAMLLVFMVPYIFGSISVSSKSLKIEGAGNPLALLATFAASGVVGLFNPYSIDAMLYVTSSYGVDDFSLITEMYPTSLSHAEGKTFFVLFALVLLIVCFVKKRAFTVRFFLLFAGTLLLGLLQIKGIPYFYLIGIPVSTHLLKDTDFGKLKGLFKDYITTGSKILFCIFMALAVVYLCEARFFTTGGIVSDRKAHLSRLDDVIAIMNESDEPVVLYTNFNDGQYLEFNGYHPYIDGRAELFLFKNNHYYDYFYEYEDLMNGYFYYLDFADKYGFNYMIVSRQSDSYLYTCLAHDEENFELLYQSYDVNLFRRIEKTPDQ